MNISKASQKLFISQPALSSQIKALEGDFKTQLFNRTNRNLKFTPAGETLFTCIAPFFDREQEIFSRVISAGESQNHSITFGFMPFGDSSVLFNVLNDFRNNHSDIDVRATRMNMDSIYTSLMHNELDVALAYIGAPDELLGLEETFLCNDYMHVVMGATNPLVKKDSITIKDLNGYSFTMISRFEAPKHYGRISDMCKNAGFDMKVTATYPYVESLFSALPMGNDIAILASLAVPKTPGLVSKPFAPKKETSVHLSLIIKESSHTSLKDLFLREVGNDLRMFFKNKIN